MDLVKIGFLVKADGLKDANTQADKLLKQVEKVSKKDFVLKLKLDSVSVTKQFKDIEALQRKIKDTQMKLSLIGYSQVKNNLEQLDKIRKNIKDIQIKVSVNSNTSKIKEDLKNLKNKTITINVLTVTTQFDKLREKLKALKNINLNIKVQIPKVSDVEKLSKAFAKLASKKVKIEITLTPDLTVLTEYANTIDRIRSSRQNTNIGLGGTGGGGSSRSPSPLLDQAIGIAKYAVLSAAIYGVMVATKNLAVATVKMADEYTAIQNRMKLYITDTEELGQVNAKLAQYAMENNVGLRETATLFARLAPSMQRIGANTAAITSVVDAFGKSMRIGGATAMEAASATIQFSQAMAAGKLQGDEFRSISEASPRFLQAIADGSGIAASKLKEMSSAGMLTTEVISKALLKEYPKLIAENIQLGATLEQGSNAMKTAFTVMVGEFNEGAKATETIGTAMMRLASSMIKTAQSARQTGEDMRNWFADNADNINMLINAFKVLTAIVVSRYVAAIILARVESIRYQATLLSMAAAQTQATRTSTLLAAALTGVGNAAKGALAFFGGWVGLGLTLTTAAASYFLLRDNTDAATKALAAQEGVVTKTTQELLKLSGAQKELEKQRMSEQFDVQKKGLEQVEQQIQAVIIAERARANFSDEMTTLLRGVKDGTISYSDALEQLNKQKGVDPKNVGTLETLIKQYNELAPKALQLAEGQRALGINVADVGNAAQNATPEVKNLANGYSDLDKAAFAASNRISALGKEIRNQIYQVRIARKLQQEEGLSSSSAGMLAKGMLDYGQIVRSSGKIRDALDGENKLRGAIERAKKSGVDTTALELKLSKLVAQNQNTIAESLRQYQKSHAGLLRQLDAENELAKEYNDIIKDRDGDKEVERLDGIRQGYQDQIDEVVRLNNLINQGVDYEAAKIAAAKDYAEAIGDAGVAQQIVAYQQLAQRLSYEASLSKETELQSRIVKLMQIGATYSQARTIAEAKFTDDLRGRQALEDTILNDMVNKQYSLTDQLSTQKSINYFLERGFSLEEATTKAVFGRLSAVRNGLTDQQRQLRDQTISQEYSIQLETSRAKVLQDLTALARESVELAYLQNNELAEIAKSYDKIDVNSVRELSTRQKIVDKMKEYNDQLAYAEANPLGDFRDINFEAFGDFGNPFKSALDGLNSMIGGTKILNESYKAMFISLQDQWDKAAEGSAARSNIEQQQAQLQIQYEDEKAKARHKAISTMLSATKSLFKEESKGYKVVSALEKAYQASKIAFALWEKREELKTLALKIAGYAKEGAVFLATTATKIAAQLGFNVAAAQGAVASAAQAPPPVGFASAAAMIALLAGLGIALSGGGSAKGTFAPTNEGTGTVFGDTDAKSESIKKSIDLLADNSDLMLPLTNAMLRSLRNIESNIGGLTNLLIRTGVGKDFNIVEGFQQNSTGKYLGMAGQLAGGVGGAIGGGLLGSFGAGLLGAGMGSALGIGLGVLTGGIGLLLGSALGSMLGGLFGTKTSVKGQGLFGADQNLASILDKGFSLQEYVDVNIKKKSFGVTTSNKNSTKLSAADQQLANQFTLIFEGFYDSILNASTALGMNVDTVANALEGTVISMGKINLQGLKGEEIQEKLTAVFGAAADKLAQTGVKGLDDFQRVGEGYYETLVRVATGIEQANYFTDRLNVTAIKYVDILNKQGDVAAEIVRQSVLLVEKTKDIKGGFYDLVNTFEGSAEELTNFIFTLRDLQDQLFMTGKDADYLTSAMILGAGGLDKLSSGLDAYFEMLSPAEQAAELTRRLTNEFAIFGKELPADVKAFRNLVSSIDISSEAGQKLYGQIIALAPEFNDLQDALESANSDVNALVKSLRDLAEQARAARGETEQPRNLAYIRSQFEATSLLAMQGDVDAANRLLDLGKTLMTLSKTYSVTGGEYAKDLAAVQRAATVSADVQEAGLGYTIGSPLTPVSGTNTAPTIEASDDANTAEIKAMREDLNAALFAIAKYTQDTANRLERWDYGDRMVVRVEQDATDVIKVKAV